MSINDEVELLRRVPLFASVPPAKLKLLAFTSDRMVFAPEQVLMKQGDAGDAAYLILSGQADVTVDTANGPLKVAVVGKNDFVGEMAILRDVPRSATVTATGEVMTLKITKDTFLQMIEDSPLMAIEILRVVTQRLEATTIDLTQARFKLKEAGIA